MNNAEIVEDFIKHRGDGPASQSAARIALARLEADAQALADLRRLVAQWEDDAARYNNSTKASCAAELRAVLRMPVRG